MTKQSSLSNTSTLDCFGPPALAMTGCRKRRLVADLHHPDLAHARAHRDLAVFEAERVLTEDYAPPAAQGRHIGVVIGGNLFQVGDGGHQLLGHVAEYRI